MKIWYLIIGFILLLCLSFVFYMVCTVDGAMFGTPEGELDSIIQDKMKNIIQVVEREAASDPNGQIGDAIDKVQFALKIVPSIDNHKFLLKRMKLKGGPGSDYNGFEGGLPYNMDALGDYSEFPYFFEWTGHKSVTFPTFKFTTDTTPIGDSNQFCLGLLWIPMRKRNHFDQYMDIKGFEECKLYSQGIAYWDELYPKYGVNFKLWDQKSKKGDTTCTNGIYVEKADTCFVYKYISQICLLVKFKKDRETNTYQWIHTGGCFDGDKAVMYKDAQVGETQNFKEIQFEVRLDTRIDSGVYSTEDGEEEEDNGDEIDTEYDPDAKKRETPANKIKKEKKKLESQVANGEIQGTSNYFFYHLFKILSLICLLAAIGCLIALIYELYWMFKYGSTNYTQLEQNMSGRPQSGVNLGGQGSGFGAGGGGRPMSNGSG